MANIVSRLTADGNLLLNGTFDEWTGTPVVDSSLILWLDAGQETSYPGTGTVWTDLSGNGNAGTLVNGPTYDGTYGGSLVFDGLDDYTIISNNFNSFGANLNLGFTASYWVKTLETRTVGLAGIVNTGTNLIWAISLNRGVGARDNESLGATQFYIRSQATNRYLVGWIGTNIYNGAWHNIVWTSTNPVNNLYIIYVNGVAVPITYTDIGSPNTWANFDYPLAISSSNSRGIITPGCSSTTISQVSIYNRALSAQEIQQNYNALAPRYGLATIANAPAQIRTTPNTILANQFDEVTKPIIDDSSLVLNLDAGRTDSYPGTGTVWTDLSGNGNTGTLTNGPTYTSVNGGSIVFDGTNDYIDCANPVSLQITTGSISAWFNADTGNSGYNSIIAKQLAWGLFVVDNVLISYDWGNSTDRSTGITVGNNTWNHVVMTFTETTGNPSDNAIIYLNGSPVLTTTIKHISNAVSVRIGGEGSNTQFFGGSIAQASIYNRRLTAAEVRQNYNALAPRYNLAYVGPVVVKRELSVGTVQVAGNFDEWTGAQ
jgi:hypothetical protein